VKIVVATDSFKGSVTARDACASVRRGVLSVIPGTDVVELPMADGGEGTAETLRDAQGGAWVAVRVTGPLPDMAVNAGFLWLPESGPGALVEMAAASGLELLAPEELDPGRATTLGTGELIAAAKERGAKRLWLAIGGSATVDGGVGMAAALGWRFLDQAGQDVGLGGLALERIARIEAPEQRLGVVVKVLCDVDNPLLGPRGAARVFGPQKGATPDMVERLESGLTNLARVVERDLDKDVSDLPGAGAAGGLGAGAVAFLDAELVSGVDAVADAAGLSEAIMGADWVITGEGRYDEQSLRGKVVSGVVERARREGVRVAVIAGSAALSAEEGGVDVVEEVAPRTMPLTEALARGEELIEAAAARVARSHLAHA
jgi:glycerate kinase